MPLFGSHGLLAQDIFHTTDSKQIETKVLEVSDDEVSNKMFNAANGVKIGPLGAKTAKKCSQWTQFSSIGSTMAPHEQGLAKRPASSKTVGRRVRRQCRMPGRSPVSINTRGSRRGRCGRNTRGGGGGRSPSISSCGHRGSTIPHRERPAPCSARRRRGCRGKGYRCSRS